MIVHAGLKLRRAILNGFAGGLGLLLLVLGVSGLSPSARAQDPQEKPAEPPAQSKEDAPPEKPELRDFVGIWKASFDGKAFTVLTLKLQEGKLIGIIRTGEVDLSEDGEVSKVNQEPGEPRMIHDIKLDGKILSFQDTDGDDVNSLELTLTGADSAELKYILPDPLPEGMPVPKPFRMTRGDKPTRVSPVSSSRMIPTPIRLRRS
jgi:hypothetical protein